MRGTGVDSGVFDPIPQYKSFYPTLGYPTQIGTIRVVMTVGVTTSPWWGPMSRTSQRPIPMS